MLRENLKMEIEVAFAPRGPHFSLHKQTISQISDQSRVRTLPTKRIPCCFEREEEAKASAITTMIKPFMFFSDNQIGHQKNVTILIDQSMVRIQNSMTVKRMGTSNDW